MNGKKSLLRGRVSVPAALRRSLTAVPDPKQYVRDDPHRGILRGNPGVGVEVELTTAGENKV